MTEPNSSRVWPLRAVQGRLAAFAGLLLLLAGIVVGVAPAGANDFTPLPTDATYIYDGAASVAHGTSWSLLRASLLTGYERQASARAEGVSARLLDFGVAAEDVAGASRVNPLGGTQNCVHCAIAGDATLSGAPASALDSAGPQLISRIEQQFGSSFKPVAGRAEIEQMLSEAGPGSRGIVFGSRGADPGHVFNAINQGGSIRFIDFQSGTGASFEGYQGFSFLWTTP